MCENSNVNYKIAIYDVYDPPYSDKKWPQLGISEVLTFSSLLGKEDFELVNKFGIKNIKELIEFDIDNIVETDFKKRLYDIKEQWQPGNWLLSTLPVHKFLLSDKPRCYTSLNNSGVKTIKDFWDLDLSDLPDLLSKYTMRSITCRIKNILAMTEVTSFAEKQRKYREQLWQTKLKKFPIDDIKEPDYNYYHFEFGSLHEFILQEITDDDIKNNIQWKYRQIYPEWKNLYVDTEILGITADKKKVKAIFAENNISTIENFINFDFSSCNINGLNKINAIQNNILPVQNEKIKVETIEEKLTEFQQCPTLRDALLFVVKQENDNNIDNFIDYVINGNTLEAISNVNNITRERCRQKINDFREKLNNIEWWKQLCENIFTGFGRITTNDALKQKTNEIINIEGIGKVIAYCLKSYKIKGNDFLIDTEIYTEEKIIELKKIIEERLIKENINNIDNNILFEFCYNDFKEYCQKYNIEYDEKYISAESLSEILMPQVKKYRRRTTLKNPVEFIHALLKGKSMFETEITKKLKDNGFEEFNGRNISSRLNLIVCEKVNRSYKYMLPEDLPELSQELLSQIIEYINCKLTTTLRFNLQDVCSDEKFRSDLKNVTPFMLKAILNRTGYGFSFDTKEACIFKSKITLINLLESKILELKRGVSKQELENIARQNGYNSSERLAIAINDSEKILTFGPKENLSYIHIDNSGVNIDDLLSEIGTTIENEKIISAQDLFEGHKEICENNKIFDCRMLGSILKKASDYFVDYPVIASDEENYKTLLQSGVDYTKNAKWRSKEDIEKFYKDIGFSNINRWWLLLNHPDILRIADDYIAHKENIKWEDGYQDEVLKTAGEALEKEKTEYMFIRKFQDQYHDELPKLSIKFPRALISDILKKSDEYIVSGPNDIIFFKKTPEIQNFEELCSHLFKKSGYIDITDFLDDLQGKHVIDDNWKNKLKNKLK